VFLTLAMELSSSVWFNTLSFPKRRLAQVKDLSSYSTLENLEMKKTLVAMAALASVSAFAQSSVTLYGTIDASVQNITRVDGLKNNTSFVDGAVSSSVWGLKGSEDLGAGKKANFEAQGDFMSNNGGTHTAGMFRRALNVGLADATAGELTLGLKGNPLIGAAAGSVPVGGNTVTTNLATALGYADFFTKNAVTYTSPAIAGGLVVTAQHGLSNAAADGESYGSVNAFSAIYTNGPLKVTAAGQARRESPAATGLSAANASTAGTLAYDSANTTNTGYKATAAVDAYKKKSQIIGVSYALTSQLTVAANRISSKAQTATANSYDAQKNATMLGLGYAVNPALTLGLNAIHAEDSNLTNVQARYALSKRTSVYGQLTQARNDANGRVNFAPVATNTGSSPAVDVNGLAGTKDKNQSAFGVGVIHTF
jgi:predicted porin